MHWKKKKVHWTKMYHSMDEIRTPRKYQNILGGGGGGENRTVTEGREGEKERERERELKIIMVNQKDI